MFLGETYKKQKNIFKNHRNYHFVPATKRAKNKVLYPLFLFDFSLKIIKTSFSIFNRNCKIP